MCVTDFSDLTSNHLWAQGLGREMNTPPVLYEEQLNITRLRTGRKAKLIN